MPQPTTAERIASAEVAFIAPLATILTQAEEGDVIAIPCLRAVSGPESMFEHVTLYGCVLFVNVEKRVLSRFYDSVEWIEPAQGTEVRSPDGAVEIVDESSHTPEWCSNNCLLLKGKRPDLPEEFLWSFAPSHGGN